MAVKCESIEDAFGEDDFTTFEGFKVEDSGKRSGKVKVAVRFRGRGADSSSVNLHRLALGVVNRDGKAAVEMFAAVLAIDSERFEFVA